VEKQAGGERKTFCFATGYLLRNFVAHIRRVKIKGTVNPRTPSEGCPVKTRCIKKAQTKDGTRRANGHRKTEENDVRTIPGKVFRTLLEDRRSGTGGATGAESKKESPARSRSGF